MCVCESGLFRSIYVWTYVCGGVCVCEEKNTTEKSTIYHHIKRTKTNIIENGRRGMGENCIIFFLDIIIYMENASFLIYKMKHFF